MFGLYLILLQMQRIPSVDSKKMHILFVTVLPHEMNNIKKQICDWYDFA